MEVKCIISPVLSENSYIITNGTKECVVIDVGFQNEKLKKYVYDNNLIVKAVLLTHGHFDHCRDGYHFAQKNIPIYIHFLDAYKLANGDMDYFKLDTNLYNSFSATNLLNDRDMFSLIGLDFNVIHIGGHTKGSVCYLVENSLFSGDVIFKDGIGNCQFYDGNYSELANNIKRKIVPLDKNLIVYAGHGESTILKNELDRLENL